ncbi:HNH endonuclease signature motif containing protein [Arenibacterium sp. CAU 1754]
MVSRHVPEQLKRQLLQEAGYRCSVPTCRGTSALQLEHIKDWAKVQAHDFDNMIVLCATCHQRVTSKEIHKDAIRSYKRNLALINGRYSLYEFRALELFHEQLEMGQPLGWLMPKTDLLHVKGLVDDGLVNLTDQIYDGVEIRASIGGLETQPIKMVPTKLGKNFVRQYYSGNPLT